MPEIHATKERWKEDLMSRRGVIGVGEGEPPAKSYINCSSSPSSAGIWLKNH